MCVRVLGMCVREIGMGVSVSELCVCACVCVRCVCVCTCVRCVCTCVADQWHSACYKCIDYYVIVYRLSVFSCCGS